MMNIPSAEPGSKFELKAGFLEENGFRIPVFEAKAMKSVILFDQDKNFVAKENQVVSVDGVNGGGTHVPWRVGYIHMAKTGGTSIGFSLAKSKVSACKTVKGQGYPHKLNFFAAAIQKLRLPLIVLVSEATNVG